MDSYFIYILPPDSWTRFDALPRLYISIFSEKMFVWGDWQLDSHGFDSQSKKGPVFLCWQKKYAANLEILGSNPAKMLGTYIQMFLAWDSRYRISHNLPQQPLMIPIV